MNDLAQENPINNNEAEHVISGSEVASEVEEVEGGIEVEIEGPPLHLIASALSRFVHKVHDIEESAKNCIPQARKAYIRRAKELQSTFLSAQEVLDSDCSAEEKLVAARNLRTMLRLAKRLSNDATIVTLERSLFIGLFTCFDKFVGELMEGVYSIRSDLFKGVGAQFSVCDVLEYPSLDEFKSAVLEKEIETVRRKSYGEQFKEFERRFGFETLTKFDSWPAFIEASQRRNLFTHCDGVISQQYLKVCIEAGYKPAKEDVVGSQLEIGAKYFYQTCHLVMEVGVMLGHTIWRKMLPDERRQADSELNSLIYDYLHLGQYHKAAALCRFAQKMPKISEDLMDRMFTLNHAIAVRQMNGAAAAKKILEKKDWSAVIYDFRLARAVLVEDYISAKEYMLKIGKAGEIVVEEAYHDWPLFKDFRETPEFLEGYEEVFGYKYLSKLSEIVSDAQVVAEQQAAEEEQKEKEKEKDSALEAELIMDADSGFDDKS
ncbi:hypothetical protein [Pseudomonas siliginis]|uniref:hypothetical protein n=1 Tax=Pseudomonas siliginis TaxID=2842346 RepID=UPI001C3CA935|nr:hypothetical protein [Pseudomonas siliginis]MBV4469312.1 hypothetical protein [Pseudomonas siliginis]